MIKEWEYEGIVYKVSDDGKIYGPKVGELKQRLNSDGYLEVTVGGMYGRRIRERTHIIIAKVFVDGYKPGLEVNHKNFIRTDNRASNLEWVTHRENVKYSYINGRHDGTRSGDKNGRAKLDWEKVNEIRNKYKNGSTISSLAREYCVGNTTISHLVKNETWKQ